MNKFPAWLNLLVLVILLAGMLLALPNLYGSVPAVQLADPDGNALGEDRIEVVNRIIENAGITPEASYLKDGRSVVRFAEVQDQLTAGERLRGTFERELSVALTLAPKLPAWVRGLGLSPMSLGLDLRGGVYVLLEVDMDTAIETRLALYQQDFNERLRDARIRNRVDLDGSVITVRLTNEADREEAQRIIRQADDEVLIDDGADGRSLRVRMTEAQIQARKDLSIEQNITTLRNRVNELGVAEPLVQRQGEEIGRAS